MQQSSWHVLHVLSNRERRVAQHLSARAVEHYLPLYRERVRWTDRTVITERPLFSGYVFARFHPQSKMIVVTTPGVIRSLGDEEADLVSSAELDRIREGLAKGYLLRPHLGVSAGTQVRIRRGIFEGVEGVVTELRRQCKVIISVAATQQSFSVEVELQDVEVVKKPYVEVKVTTCNAIHCRYHPTRRVRSESGQQQRSPCPLISTHRGSGLPHQKMVGATGYRSCWASKFENGAPASKRNCSIA